MSARTWWRVQSQRIAGSPLWRIGRWVLVVLGFLLTWTGWTGPELLEEFGGDFWQSDAFRTTLVVIGLLLVLAVVLVPAPFRPEDWVVGWGGSILPVQREPAGYKATCDRKEGKWWLVLERPSDEPARFIVTVEHESGRSAHYDFRQGGDRMVAWYPDMFDAEAMPQRQPWGKYAVKWEISPSTGGKHEVRTTFEWHEGQ